MKQQFSVELQRKCRDDPFFFFRLCWPKDKLWSKQRAIVESVRDNYGTICHAAVEMGKDYIAARLIWWFYLTRFPAKVIATSTSFGQLRNALWGELGRARRASRIEFGVYMKETQEIQRKDAGGRTYEDDWVRLSVVRDVESMSGAHLPRGPNGEPTVFAVVDEASGVKEDFASNLEGQAHVLLAIGNPERMTGYFLDKVQGGDVPDPLYPGRLRWKIVHIDAEQSPNVQKGIEWDQAGRDGDCPQPVPGVMNYGDYLSHKSEWDARLISVKLHGLPAPPGGVLFDSQYFRYCRSESIPIGERRVRKQFVLNQGDGSGRRVWWDECRWVQTIDTASKEGESNDYTVILTGAVTPNPPLIVVVDVDRRKLVVPQQFGHIMQAREKWPLVTMQAVEDKASGIGLIQESKIKGIPFRALRADRSKIDRAVAILVAYQNGLVYHHTKGQCRWLGDFERELIEFPAGKHDDQADALAYLGMIYQEWCYNAALGEAGIVAYPYRKSDDEDEVDDTTSLAEQLTGRRQGATGGRSDRFGW